MKNSAKEGSAIHTRESAESQKACKNSVVVTFYRQCRRNDPHTVILSQLIQEQTLLNHEPPHQRTNNATKEQNPTAEETQPKEDNRSETNTPLPTTPIQCSTGHGPRPSQREDEQQTTPIRATVIAEGTSETGITNKEKGKTETKEMKLKNNKVTVEQSADLRRSNRIKGTRRTEKLGGVE